MSPSTVPIGYADGYVSPDAPPIPTKKVSSRYDVENLDWPTGCSLWDDCLTCPLSRCVYDEDREAFRQLIYREAEELGIKPVAQSARSKTRARSRTQ